MSNDRSKEEILDNGMKKFSSKTENSFEYIEDYAVANTRYINEQVVLKAMDEYADQEKRKEAIAFYKWKKQYKNTEIKRLQERRNHPDCKTEYSGFILLLKDFDKINYSKNKNKKYGK